MLSIVVLLLTANLSVGQESKMVSVVTTEEYKSLDETEKRLADYVNGAVASLKALKLNKSTNYAKYEASISISLNSKDKLSNNIAVGESDGPPVANAQSCTICGVGSARNCFKRIRTVLANGQPLVITVIETNGGDCYQITWN